MRYNPAASVLSFLTANGDLGEVVLESFNTVDPMHCYYGIPDEYLGYAERFVESLQQALGTNQDLKDSRELVEELVRRSFYPAQILKGFVTTEALHELTEQLHNRIWSTRVLHGVWP